MSWVAMTILCKRHKYKSDIPDNMLLLFFATIFVIPCIYFGSSLGRMLCGGIVISGIFTTLKQIKFITRHIINKNVS